MLYKTIKPVEITAEQAAKVREILAVAPPLGGFLRACVWLRDTVPCRLAQAHRAVRQVEAGEDKSHD